MCHEGRGKEHKKNTQLKQNLNKNEKHKVEHGAIQEMLMRTTAMMMTPRKDAYGYNNDDDDADTGGAER